LSYGKVLFIDGEFKKQDILVSNGRIAAVCNCLYSYYAEIIDCENKHVFPGFADVHVHLREPGFIYKENILSGTKAAAHGGYSVVCAMPNLDPVPDNEDSLNAELEAIRKTAVISVKPYGSITIGEKGTELSDMDAMAPYVVGFSDDGKGLQNDDVMRAAMLKAKSLDKIIVAHCEDNSLLNGGYIHDGEYAKLHNHKGISSKSEWGQIQRDLKLVKETGCKYHVCHISTKESVELIRKAKTDGLDVTCETTPHYLTLTDMDIKEDGRFKMNPPLRSDEDKDALIEGITDGTIDMIATDHAPHSAEEKGRGLQKSLMGIVGLETAFPILYTEFVRPGIISLEKLIELMNVNPCRRFNLNSAIELGAPANLTMFDLNDKYTIDSHDFLSKGKSTPFEGRKVYGRCLMTTFDGNIAWGELK
jgi:dihydroorotase